MIARAWAAAVVVSLSVVGCASMDGGRSATQRQVKDCQSTSVNCVVVVDTFCADNPSLACVILLSDAVVTLKPSNGTKHVAWTIDDSAKFEFPENAITISSDAFDCPVKTSKRWQCMYKKSNPTAPEQYKYDVRLKAKEAGGRSVSPFDPWVVTN